MTSSPETSEAPVRAIDRDPRLRLLIPLLVGVGFLMEQLDATVLTTAIPSIAGSLHIAPVRMNLAVSAYVLTLAVFIPVSGWFADRFGARSVFAVALGTFTLGSALCGMADSFGFLVATRILQGFGGAMMTPVGRLILLRSFPRSEMLRAMAYVSYPAIFGPLIGPLLGGFFATYASWRWIFYINVPFGVIGVLLTLRYAENYKGDDRSSFDFLGFGMVGFGLAAIQFGMENVGHAVAPKIVVVGAFVSAAALLAGFSFYQRSVESPAVDLSLFRTRSFRIGALCGGLCRIAMNSMPFLLPLMLQIGFGLRAVESGSLTFVSVGGVLLARPVITRLLRLVGFRTLLCFACVGGSIVLAGFALFQPTTPHAVIMIYVFFAGLAQSCQFMTSNTLSYSDIPDSRLSRATSLGGVIQQLTVSFGVSTGAMLLQIIDPDGSKLTPQQFHQAFLLMSIGPLLAFPGFWTLRPTDGAQVSGYKPKA